MMLESALSVVSSVPMVPVKMSSDAHLQASPSFPQ